MLAQKAGRDNPLQALMPGERRGGGSRGKDKSSERPRMLTLGPSRHKITGAPHPGNTLTPLKSNFSLWGNDFKLLGT